MACPFICSIFPGCGARSRKNHVQRVHGILRRERTRKRSIRLALPRNVYDNSAIAEQRSRARPVSLTSGRWASDPAFSSASLQRLNFQRSSMLSGDEDYVGLHSPGIYCAMIIDAIQWAYKSAASA
ncbi:hypothetical protein PLICRDRAFT_339208 [Plicaturopsis crispa FD-325 SS-3]|uniref:Uncharacterized protein n=1 Tax=Plicaturopsis crispa FD-325 SS-3 TaxID=944288 RepID=A0A0C9SS56_PLICR|nr:hypothetical protein PLICRDRAFT_339208 [Plicaturopsis crispa FD-325 SS-3]